MTEIDIATVPELVEELRQGRMVILVDDEDRENEGDFVVAAELVTVEQLVVMNRLASGIITVPMPRSWLERLHVDPMVQENAESMNTAFTVTVDARAGVDTGSSALDRQATIRKLASPNSKAEDFVRPGHVNPLLVREGGVLKRAGHTEASHDLMRLAGLCPVAVLCEIMDDDGRMTRLPGLDRLAKRLGLKLGTIADVIRYRRQTEKLVALSSTTKADTRFGPLTVSRFRSTVDSGRYTALVHGAVSAKEPTLVRIHAGTPASDLLGLLGGVGQGAIEAAMAQISQEPSGVFLYIERPGEDGADERDYGIGAQVLLELGVHQLRLITNHPKRRAALEGFGLDLIDCVPLEPNQRDVVVHLDPRRR